MTKSIIVGYDKNRAIGANGDLPWKRDLPADLANLRRLSKNGSVIMGRKTFDSIGRLPLPDRENIVVTSSPTGVPGVLSAINLESAYALARYPIFVFGGQRIFAESLEDVDVIHATEVDAEFPGCDTFFPALDDSWKEVSRLHHPADEKNKYDFDFVEYRKATSA